MIKLEKFSKSYNFSKNSFAVKDISFIVPDGSVTALIGPNGSGKSTIIKAVCGFHYSTKGKIFLGTENNFINIEENPQYAMKSIGYVPEKPVLPSNLYVYNFLEYAALNHGLSGAEKEKEIQRVCKECELEDVISKKIKTLSKGYSQRVSFAQSLIHNPQNLVLDEPISGLDPKQIVHMRKLIKTLSEKKAVLLSTHIFQEVTSLCDNIIIINNGKLIAYGTEEEIKNKTNCNNLDEAFIKLTEEEEK